MIASVDFETRSTTDLNKAGVYRYAEDPNTEAWCMGYAFGDEEPRLWWEGDPFPEALEWHIEAGGEMRAWNAAFERTIWRMIMTPRHGWPEPKMAQWHCTAAEAAAMSLPRKLETAAAVTKVAHQKDATGHRLMRTMCAPRKPRKGEAPGLYWHEMTPERKTILGGYCGQDVNTERSMYGCTRRLIPSEREVYLLNERMNDRGIYLDTPLVVAAKKIATRAVDEATEALVRLTGGEVAGPTKIEDLKEWIERQGVAAPSLAKKSIALILEKDIPEEVREAIRLRQEGGKASTAKLVTMLKVVGANSRLHGLSLYHGAGTGRFSGRLVQPHNFPRGEVDNVENYIADVMSGAYTHIDLLAPPLVVVSSMLRSMLTAAPDFDLMAADYAAIECRAVNWLAGQEDVLESFRLYDAAPKAEKINFDPYRIMAVKMGRGASPAEVTVKGRQAGKAAELGCGFQMGPDKFVTAAWDVYQVRVTIEESRAAVKIYRESHQRVKQSWADANNAVIGAVDAPGSVHYLGPKKSIKVTYRGAYLYIILPSGRPLVYAAPSIVARSVPWETDEKPEKRPAVQFYGMHPAIRQWAPMYLYGGLIVENIVQALARDIMVDGTLGVERAGYLPILNVHDEIVSEVHQGHGTLEEYESILRTPPAWAESFPIMTEGWRGTRYRK